MVSAVEVIERNKRITYVRISLLRLCVMFFGTSYRSQRVGALLPVQPAHGNKLNIDHRSITDHRREMSSCLTQGVKNAVV